MENQVSSTSPTGEFLSSVNLNTRSAVLSDVLNNARNINTFSSATREFQSLSTRLDDQSLSTTILAPTNIAIEKLPNKPWEKRDDYSSFGIHNGYVGKQGEKRANENLKKFVKAHIIPGTFTKEQKASTLAGQEIYWDKCDDGGTRVCVLWVFGSGYDLPNLSTRFFLVMYKFNQSCELVMAKFGSWVAR
ncbi:hypothetical protein LOZ61_006018 [Ophidiomyces ophidiicola]|uniref:Uncharacterized protein n=1 Tax=Ophidiomyces ophidiicola TaxID=1387563 RepID=A0ACB8UU39_9EURO|nr:hypothetical protein LOZ61_006018 [Ophidiomyces ophidiicola]KAI1922862.1 hypothetical protein LOZ60_005457 [Ophidiomyces ophidiicola]KAI1955511.1 hypothetical protein LOZ59_004503 [Ophidiomyces ophidiicola]KAI1968924.1 hypothetical protein LOZ56_004669 [Ophidiomyces ophidiicola]KAI2005008.1 hypothetical protein LOZ50_003899 [Ophidiomyces ophidiicola]